MTLPVGPSVIMVSILLSITERAETTRDGFTNLSHRGGAARPDQGKLDVTT